MANETGMPTLSTEFVADTSNFGNAVEQLAKLVDDRTEQMSEHIGRIQQSVGESTESLRGIADPMRHLLSMVTVPTATLAAALGIDEAASKAKQLLDSFQDIQSVASSTGLSTDRVQEMQFAFGANGIGEDETNQSLTKLSGLLADAAVNNNKLQKLFQANNLTVTDTNGKLITMDQLIAQLASLYQNATGPVQQQMNNLLGLSQKFGQTLAMGPAALNKLAQSGEDTGAVIDKQLVQEAADFDREWNLTATKFKAGMKAAIVEIGDLLAGLGQKVYDALNVGGILDMITEAMTREFGGLRGMSVDELEAAKNASLLSHNLQEVKRIQDELDRRQGVITIPPPPRPSADTTRLPKLHKDDLDAYDKEVNSLNKHVAALEADRLAIGQTQAQAEQYKAELGLLQAAQRDNANVTNEQIEAYTRYRQTMSAANALAAAGINLNQKQATEFAQVTQRVGEAAKELQQSKTAYEGVQDAVKTFGTETEDVFENMITKSKKWQQEERQILQAFTKDLLEAGLTGSGPFAKLLGLAPTAAGGTGGIFGLLASAFSGFHADGGSIGANQFGVTGEAGPEIVTGPATVIPMNRLNSSTTTSRADINVNVSGARGNQEIKAMVNAGVAEGLGAYDAALPGRLSDVQRRYS